MRRQMTLVSLALGIVLTLAGCGGTSGYSLARTEACFKSKGYVAEPVSSTLLHGAGGNLRVALGAGFGYEFVFLVFGRDHTDALAIENKAVDLSLNGFKKMQNVIFTRADVLAGVAVSRNVFYYSNTQMIAQNVRLTVQHCLR